MAVPWLLIFTTILLFTNHSYAKHGKKLPSAVVIGSVYCDTCYQQDFSENSHFMSGASVAVKCGDRNPKASFYKQVKTNKHGVFKVVLPTAVSKHIQRIKGCSVKLVHSSEPFCAVASSATSSTLHLKGRQDGTHVFSAGVFTFKPLKQPKLCNQKQKVLKSKGFSSHNTLSDKKVSLFPPILPPILPSPPPNIGGIPLPPNPLEPPPLIPNPLQPPPPAFGIPGLPPIPVLTPPPPPAFGIPGLPPLPPGIPPLPGIPSLPPFIPLLPPPPPPPSLLPPGFPGIPPLIPGIPPASVAKTTSP